MTLHICTGYRIKTLLTGKKLLNSKTQLTYEGKWQSNFILLTQCSYRDARRQTQNKKNFSDPPCLACFLMFLRIAVSK